MIKIHDRVRPESVPQFVAGHHFSRSLQQHRQQLEGLLLQSDAQPPLRQLAVSEIDLENTKPQTSGRVIGLHGKLKLMAKACLVLRRLDRAETMFIPKRSRRRLKPTRRWRKQGINA
jgi:hypothetical protein